MDTSHSQRWKLRRDFYRRPDEQIQTWRYEVTAIADDKTAKQFVIKHHYSGKYPAAVRRFGLYERDQLVGCAVFSEAMNKLVYKQLPCHSKYSVELGRLVLLDSVPGNGESYFVARCFELLKQEGFLGIVSFSDPLPRPDIDGNLVFPGHVGFCYQALNAAYVGRSSSKYLSLLPDGSVFSPRTASKIRAKANGKPAKVCQGWEYGVRDLVAWGADEPGNQDLGDWLRFWLTKLTRSVYHPGNYRYLWVLDRHLRPKLPPALQYPKVTIRPDRVVVRIRA